MLLACFDHLADRVDNASSSKVSCRVKGGLLQMPILQQRRNQIARVRRSRSSSCGPAFSHAKLLQTGRRDAVLKIKW